MGYGGIFITSLLICHVSKHRQHHYDIQSQCYVGIYNLVRFLMSYTHSFIPWIHKFVIATIGCGIIHKYTKHTDKCSNNKTKTTQKQ